MAISLHEIDSAIHSIEIKTAAGQALSIDGSGYLTSNINGTVTVTATQLDIDDLSSASDNVEIRTAAGQALAIDGSGYLTVNGNGTFTVSATQLDIDDLSSATDNVEIRTAAGQALAINGDGSINALTSPGGFSTYEVTAETVGTTEVELVSTPLSGRLSIMVQNLSNNDIYIKEATGVTTANGFLLPKRSSYEANLDDGANLFAIASAGASNSVRVVEYAA